MGIPFCAAAHPLVLEHGIVRRAGLLWGPMPFCVTMSYTHTYTTRTHAHAHDSAHAVLERGIAHRAWLRSMGPNQYMEPPAVTGLLPGHAASSRQNTYPRLRAAAVSWTYCVPVPLPSPARHAQTCRPCFVAVARLLRPRQMHRKVQGRAQNPPLISAACPAHQGQRCTRALDSLPACRQAKRAAVVYADPAHMKCLLLARSAYWQSISMAGRIMGHHSVSMRQAGRSTQACN